MNGGPRIVVPTSRFKRAYRRYISKNRERLAWVEATLDRMRLDPRDPKLKTHSLKGQLEGSFACSCGYDCRIVFTIESDPSGTEIILLHDIGAHDQVY